MPDYVTIKLYADTRRLLRLIAAQSGEQMVQVMQRLCENEWARVRSKSTDDSLNDLHAEESTDKHRITEPNSL